MRLMRTVGTILAVFLLAGCLGENTPERQTTTEGNAVSRGLVPHYTGGCEEGFDLYVQNQFSVAKGVYGTLVRRSLDFERTIAASVGLQGNEPLKAIGWVRTKRVFYPKNPEGLRGEVWFYALNLPGGAGWVPDAGVRAVRTEPSPGDRDEDFKPGAQAAPQPPGCELFPL